LRWHVHGARCSTSVMLKSNSNAELLEQSFDDAFLAHAKVNASGADAAVPQNLRSKCSYDTLPIATMEYASAMPGEDWRKQQIRDDALLAGALGSVPHAPMNNGKPSPWTARQTPNNGHVVTCAATKQQPLSMQQRRDDAVLAGILQAATSTRAVPPAESPVEMSDDAVLAGILKECSEQPEEGDFISPIMLAESIPLQQSHAVDDTALSSDMQQASDDAVLTTALYRASEHPDVAAGLCQEPLPSSAEVTKPAKVEAAVPAIVAGVATLLRQARGPLLFGVEVAAGGRGRGEELHQLCNPLGVTFDAFSRTLLVADNGNCRVVRWNRGGKKGSLVAGGRSCGFEWFDPFDVAAEPSGGVLVAASGNLEIWAAGALEGAVLASGSCLSSVLLEGNGSILFADVFESVVSRWSKGLVERIFPLPNSDGNSVTVGGASCRLAPSATGPRGQPPRRSRSQLYHPHGIALDSGGAVLIADSGNHRILRWVRGAAKGEVVAGGRGKGSRLDQLCFPRSVVAEGATSILVADTRNDRVVRWTQGSACGEVVAGGRGRGDRLDQLNRPVGLALDSPGTLLIADSGNHRVLRWPIRPHGLRTTDSRTGKRHAAAT